MRIKLGALQDYETSVVVVPPLGRDNDLKLAKHENRKLIRHIENGGVSILMYGGNANFYNIPISEYEATLDFLSESVSADTWIIPAVGPDYGRMCDQAAVARGKQFPTIMVLPTLQMATSAGLEHAIRKTSDQFGAPIVLYMRNEEYLGLDRVGKLHAAGYIYSIKYAIQRVDPLEDQFLRDLIGIVGAERVISGIGERPAIDHFRAFGLKGFTSGSGSVAPGRSMDLLRALQAGNIAEAERLRRLFLPLEDLRDAHNPARILHDAVTLSGVANMGPILPLLSNVEGELRTRVGTVAAELAANEQNGNLGSLAVTAARTQRTATH